MTPTWAMKNSLAPKGKAWTECSMDGQKLEVPDRQLLQRGMELIEGLYESLA